MTLQQVYSEAKALPDDQRRQLVDLILSDLRPEPPNTFHNEQELEQMLLEGMEGDLIPITPEYWASLHKMIEDRAAAKR